MKVLACIMLWGLLAVFSCTACVDSLLAPKPAAQVALIEPIVGQGVPQDLPIQNIGGVWTNRPDGDLEDRPGSFSQVPGGYVSSLELWAAPIEHRMFSQPLCRVVSLANAAHAGGTMVCGSETASIREERVRRRGNIVTTTDTVLAVGGRELMRIQGRSHEHDPGKTVRLD